MAPDRNEFRYSDTIAVDYVFVDEHNRHKRLKGIEPFLSAWSWGRHELTLLRIDSYESLRGLPEEKNKMRRSDDKYLAMLSLYSPEAALRAP
jgi:hypothetical protein